MKLNALTIIGTIINTFITVVIFASDEYAGLNIIMLIALLLCFLGLIIIQFGSAKTGSIIFIIGSVPFIPIGLIGVFGVRKLVQKVEDDKFKEENYG